MHNGPYTSERRKVLIAPVSGLFSRSRAFYSGRSVTGGGRC